MASKNIKHSSYYGFHVFCMVFYGFPWLLHGFLWLLHGFLCVLHGGCMVFYRFSMVVAWFSMDFFVGGCTVFYGLSIVFAWFSIVFFTGSSIHFSSSPAVRPRSPWPSGLRSSLRDSLGPPEKMLVQGQGMHHRYTHYMYSI